jgi:endonuclease/exonuclease/phosphatase (EEP) superfamily protein YafD
MLLSWAVFLLIVSFIHRIKYEAWWIRIFDFPHLQLATLTALSLLVELFTADYRAWPDLAALGILGVVFAYHSHLIVPFTRLHTHHVPDAQQKKPDDAISLMVGNVLMFNTQYAAYRDMIFGCKPDIVLLLEPNKKWRDGLADVRKKYRYGLDHALENTYGMLLYSNLELLNLTIHHLVEDDIPSISAQVKLRSGRIIDFYGVHPQPPSPTEHYRSTERDAELILVGKTVKANNRPAIVLGDLNDVAWSYTTQLFKKMSGMLDLRIGRGLFNTFHAHYWLLRWPLDHIFTTFHFKVDTIRRLPNCGSDHFPIFTKLYFEPDEETKDEIVKPDEKDHEIATEKVGEALNNDQ